MADDNKLKHIDLIQAIVTRMASNSFLLKGWSVTLVSALFALAAKDANKNYIIVAFLPVLVFWILDAYFLCQERRFRALYNEIIKKTEAQITFTMDTTNFRSGKNTWPSAFFSITLLLFYASMLGIMLVVMCRIK